MMNVVKKLFRGAGGLLAFIYPYKFHRLLSYLIANYCYTGWVNKEFRILGNNAFIRRPLHLYGGEYITIGSDFRAEPGLRLEAHGRYHNTRFNPEITIGNRVSINFGCHIAAVNKITIGDDVLLASKVFITDHYHGVMDEQSLKLPTALRTLNSKGPVEIQNNVWIGENVCIMPDVTIGEGCVIGANSVVTKSFPPRSIIGGVPAKIIRTLA